MIGKLHREQPFVMRVAVDDIKGLDCPKDTGEKLLIQGVVDVWFEEADGIVLLDYKTDRVSKNSQGEELVKRYAIQLDYYQKALETITGKKVKERFIYSITLGKEISC